WRSSGRTRFCIARVSTSRKPSNGWSGSCRGSKRSTTSSGSSAARSGEFAGEPSARRGSRRAGPGHTLSPAGAPAAPGGLRHRGLVPADAGLLPVRRCGRPLGDGRPVLGGRVFRGPRAGRVPGGPFGDGGPLRLCAAPGLFGELSDRARLLRGRQLVARIPALLCDVCLRVPRGGRLRRAPRSEEHTSELQSRENLVCRLLLEKKNTT